MFLLMMGSVMSRCVFLCLKVGEITKIMKAYINMIVKKRCSVMSITSNSSAWMRWSASNQRAQGPWHHHSVDQHAPAYRRFILTTFTLKKHNDTSLICSLPALTRDRTPFISLRLLFPNTHTAVTWGLDIVFVWSLSCFIKLWPLRAVSLHQICAQCSVNISSCLRPFTLLQQHNKHSYFVLNSGGYTRMTWYIWYENFGCKFTVNPPATQDFYSVPMHSRLNEQCDVHGCLTIQME